MDAFDKQTEERLNALLAEGVLSRLAGELTEAYGTMIRGKVPPAVANRIIEQMSDYSLAHLLPSEWRDY